MPVVVAKGNVQHLKCQWDKAKFMKKSCLVTISIETITIKLNKQSCLCIAGLFCTVRNHYSSSSHLSQSISCYLLVLLSLMVSLSACRNVPELWLGGLSRCCCFCFWCLSSFRFSRISCLVFSLFISSHPAGLSSSQSSNSFCKERGGISI